MSDLLSHMKTTYSSSKLMVNRHSNYLNIEFAFNLICTQVINEPVYLNLFIEINIYFNKINNLYFLVYLSKLILLKENIIFLFILRKKTFILKLFLKKFKQTHPV